MRALRAFGKYFWRFMVIFSFIVNLVLVLVVAVLLLTIFDIKRNIAEPLIQGLHSSFVGLNDATIDWTIPVRDTIIVADEIPLNLNIPLQKDTVVTLTQDVALNLNANITLPGVGVLNNAQVALALPKDTQLPVRLDLIVEVTNQTVPVNLTVPVDLDVRAVIPLGQTQLHDPVDNLRLLFEPLTRVLGNLPNDYGQVGPFVSQVLSGNAPNLLAETPYSQDPWPGYSITAGLNYESLAYQPIPAGNIPLLTGIVPVGGIPLLDEGLRPDLYQGDSTPQTMNAQAEANLQAQSVPNQTFNGDYGEQAASPRQQAIQPGQQPQPIQPTPLPAEPGVAATPVPPGGDLGIIPTAQPNSP
ncbi:MAG: hypothetical protein JNM70_03030 [Anaerolineae bacterium]|nr:hypothetical protein [Anaerolineae bacterium]